MSHFSKAKLNLYRVLFIFFIKVDGAEEVAERRSRTTDDDDDGVRTVLVRKATDEGLGLTITGGREHHLPVVISELHRGAPADLCGRLAVGDVILSVNDVDLTQVGPLPPKKNLTELKLKLN